MYDYKKRWMDNVMKGVGYALYVMFPLPVMRNLALSVSWIQTAHTVEE